MSSEQIEQMMAQMAQFQAQHAAPPAAPPPPATYAPPPGMPQGMPAGYGMPQGAQLPLQGQLASADVITNLPPPSLPVGTYDFEVQFVERKSGVSDKGPWENLRYRFTVLAGPLVGQSVTDSLSTKFTRPLFALAAACLKPIAQDGNFNVQSLNGCRITADVTYDSKEYAHVGGFKPLAR
ncbi:MAG: hypothetical protein M0R22_00045 [Dehalococcoidia bacterium]|nr:hypothetical protein [Dehalococcoidia bacterium]